jgi:hypothetical protein
MASPATQRRGADSGSFPPLGGLQWHLHDPRAALRGARGSRRRSPPGDPLGRGEYRGLHRRGDDAHDLPAQVAGSVWQRSTSRPDDRYRRSQERYRRPGQPVGRTQAGNPSGFEPDGDSIQFKPTNPQLLDRLDQPGRPYRLTLIDSTQLRLEGIDALELHFDSTHQPRPLADEARDFLTGKLRLNRFPIGRPATFQVKGARPAHDPIESPVSNAIASAQAWRGVGGVPLMVEKLTDAGSGTDVMRRL